MKNCLVTKLNSSVSNPELKKLGYVRISFRKAQTNSANRALITYLPSIIFTSTHNVKVWKDNNVIYDGTNANITNVSGSKILEFPDEDGWVDIYSNDYTFGGISVLTASWSHPLGVYDYSNPVSYCFDGEELSFQFIDEIRSRADAIEGEFIPGPSLTFCRLNFGGGVQNGVVINLANIPSTIQEFNFEDNNNIIGDVESLSRCVVMTQCNIYRCSKVTGDVKNLFDTLFNNGKVSGELYFVCYNGGVTTWNGEPLTNQKILELTNNARDYAIRATFSASGYTLS